MKEPFDKGYETYEAWFEANRDLYERELAAVRSVLPPFRRAIEVGVGTGRFAQPLGIPLGLDPSPGMAGIARKKGLQVVEGAAERIPFPDRSFDLVLMVTVLCFLDDVDASLREVHRVLEEEGHLVLAFLDRESRLGREIERTKGDDEFFSTAKLYAADEVMSLLRDHGLTVVKTRRTLMDDGSDAIMDGYGESGFVVAAARKTPACAGACHAD